MAPEVFRFPGSCTEKPLLRFGLSESCVGPWQQGSQDYVTFKFYGNTVVVVDTWTLQGENESLVPHSFVAQGHVSKNPKAHTHSLHSRAKTLGPTNPHPYP